jgi:antitoxin MazE
MQTKVQRWGNSLGLRIPRSFAAEARVGEGSLVKPVRTRKYSLRALLRKVKPGNLHREVRLGGTAGRESW